MYLFCRTIGLSDYRTVGLLDRRSIELSNYRSDPALWVGLPVLVKHLIPHLLHYHANCPVDILISSVLTIHQYFIL